MDIENKSMDIIETALGVPPFSEEEKTVVKRMIHTTGDTDYRNIVIFKNDFIRAAEISFAENLFAADKHRRLQRRQ